MRQSSVSLRVSVVTPIPIANFSMTVATSLAKSNISPYCGSPIPVFGAAE